MLSYASIPLDPPGPEQAGRLLSGVDPAWAPDLPDLWPARLPLPPARVGVLSWPTWGASRFSTGYYLATDAQLTAIRDALYSSTYAAKPLVIDDGIRSISPPMWMLPPRPVAQITGAPGCWLLTLVDDRYRWRFAQATTAVTAGTTTWADLFAAVASALAITLPADPVPAAYLQPPVDFAGLQADLPAYLDEVAAAVGMRLAFGPDGQARVQSPLTAYTAHQANLTRNARLAGGELALTP